MKTCIHDQKGQSLVEMIVIVGMVVLLATGIVVGTTASLSRSETSKSRSEALELAQAGLELTRSLRDAGWNSFVSKGSLGGTLYCFGSDEDWNEIADISLCPLNIDGTYTRSVKLTFAPIEGVPTMAVTSRVTWADTADPSNSIQLTTYLTQWK